MTFTRLRALAWPCAVIAALFGGCSGDEPAPPTTSVTKDVGTEGGELTLGDGTALIIPAGALTETTTITITAVPPDADDVFVGGLVLEPDGLILQEPATMRVPLPSDWPGNDLPVVYETLGLDPDFAYPRGEDATVVDGFAEVSIEHFSCAVAAENCHAGTIKHLLGVYEKRGCDRQRIMDYVNDETNVGLSDTHCGNAGRPQVHGLVDTFMTHRGSVDPGVPLPPTLEAEMFDAVLTGREVVLAFGRYPWPEEPTDSSLAGYFMHTGHLRVVDGEVILHNTQVVGKDLRAHLGLVGKEAVGTWPADDLDTFRELRTGVAVELQHCGSPGCLNAFYPPPGGVSGADARCHKDLVELCVSKRKQPWRAMRVYIEPPDSPPAFLCGDATSTVTFPDPSSQWTFALTFPGTTKASAIVHDDEAAYNDQWVELTLEGYPADAHAWGPIDVGIDVTGPGQIESLRLYPASNNWDPASRSLDFVDFAPGGSVPLGGTGFYWLYVYIDDPMIAYDYTMQIFQLKGGG